MSTAPLLQLREICRSFSGTPVLEGVDFELRAGEIHALLGENGAGKSTLIKIISGLLPPDSGSIILDGKTVRFSGFADAALQGISAVYQEISLLPNLSVSENLCLGREPSGPLGIRWRAMDAQARECLRTVGLEGIDVRRELGSFSIAVRQLIAIARALKVNGPESPPLSTRSVGEGGLRGEKVQDQKSVPAKILILDEPTSSLDEAESKRLFNQMRSLKAQGIGIIFVTHFLDQVDEVSDRITVLRNGKLVGTWDKTSLTRNELVGHMIGRSLEEISSTEASTHPEPGEVLLNASGLLKGVELEVKEGEMVGLAGLLGSGRTETLRAIFGLDKHSGTVTLGGKSIKDAIRQGMALCPEDRRGEGIFPGLTVEENLLILTQNRSGWLGRIGRKQRESMRRWMQTLGVRPDDPTKLIEHLSGGNQQKVVLARWLMTNPKFMMLDEPTRGIDIGAKFDILKQVLELRRQGAGVLFASSEIAEVVRTCSKVVLLQDQKAVKQLEGAEITEDNLTHVLAGEAE